MSIFKRRSQTRTQRRCAAPVHVRIKGERRGFRRVDDIGPGGFRAHTELRLRPGQHVPVRLRFPDLREELELEVRVAWRSRNGDVGIDYRHLGDDETQLLQLFIAHQEVLGQMQR